MTPLDIFLHPGDHYFADRDTRIRTVLGSCVAVTFWHPQLLVGGMCHFMLPGRSYKQPAHLPAPDGRYADAAIALLLKEIDEVGAPYREYQVKLFGGGNMFPHSRNTTNLGLQNIKAARRLIKHFGFSCVAEHLGDAGHRNIVFEVWNGEVWVRHSQILPLAEYQSADRS